MAVVGGTGATYTGPIGPSSPYNAQGTANNVNGAGVPIKPAGTYSLQQPQGQVLGASTSSGQNYSFGNTSSPDLSNPSKQTDYQNYLNSLPQQGIPADNTPDYQSIIQPTLDALNGAIAPANQAYSDAVSGINANADASKADANNQQQFAQQTAADQSAANTQGANQQVNQQRQGASESVRAIQAQFGGSQGAGAYLGEQAYRGGLQNIGQIHQSLQTAQNQINTQVQNINNIHNQTLQQIDAQTQQATAAAQQQLQQTLQQIRMAQAQTQSQKAQLTAQHLQDYQALVNQINAQNSQLKANAAVSYQQTQQVLAMYGQKVGAAQQQLKNVALPPNPLTGQKNVGSYNPSTGGYTNATGSAVDTQGNPTSGAGGGQLLPTQYQQPTGGGSLQGYGLNVQGAVPQQSSLAQAPDAQSLQRLNGLFA